jgi:23S rRNA pseudouridine2604 synthase
MRINKYLSAQGVCSRREADRLLEAGRITVDGVVAECGQQVDESSIICIDGSRIS